MGLRIFGFVLLVGGVYFGIEGSARDVGRCLYYCNYPHVP